MTDTTVPLARVVTFVLWTLGAFALIAAWVVTLTASHATGDLLGITAIVFCAVAGVSQIRCYVLRVCTLLRLVRSEQEVNAELHGLR